MKYRNSFHGFSTLGLLLIFTGSQEVRANLAFSPAVATGNVFSCSTNMGKLFTLTLETENNMNPLREKFLVTLEANIQREVRSNRGVALPASPAELPTRTHYVAGPFSSETNGDLDHHSLTFVAQLPTLLRGIVSGYELSGGFSCQSEGAFVVIGKAETKYRSDAKPDIDQVKANADLSAALACAGLHAERISDYEENWDTQLLPETWHGDFLLYSVHAHYSCQE